MHRAGDQVGPYILINKLGKGGFGVVWLAEKRSQLLSKKVALKLIDSDQVDFKSIQHEAVVWEQASGHPNVLPIIDADVYDGQVVIVSEYAEGGSLADKLKEVGTTTVIDAVDLILGVLNGLQFLHERRIIHRDIKPQNILLQGKTPRLADFGISRLMQTAMVSSTIIGTEAYMSPESFDGKRSVQSDIWSVGVVFYELLNGKLPFPQTHPSERMFAVLTKEFEPLPADIPSDLRSIVSKALAKLPENRFLSAAEMFSVLEKARVRILHPTMAKTDVYEKDFFISGGSEAIDPEETVVRQNFILPETANNMSIATKVQAQNVIAPPALLTNAQQTPQSADATAQKVMVSFIGGTILCIFAAIFFATLYSNSGKTQNTATINRPVYTTPTPFPTNSKTPSPTPTPYAVSNLSNYSLSNTSNTYSNNSTSNMSNASNSNTTKVVPAGATFCEGYVFGWNETFRSKKSAAFKIPTPPPCPDPKKYRESLRDGFGGQIAGTLDAMGRINGKK